MKLLIGGSSTFMFHLQEFAKKLNELGLETKLVYDADYTDGFPSRKISKWFETKTKLKEIIKKLKLCSYSISIKPLFQNIGFLYAHKINNQ